MASRGIMVKVARTGTRAIEIALNENQTVKDALKVAKLRVKASEDTYVNGEPADLGDGLDDGDRVVLVKSIKGGN